MHLSIKLMYVPMSSMDPSMPLINKNKNTSPRIKFLLVLILRSKERCLAVHQFCIQCLYFLQKWLCTDHDLADVKKFGRFASKIRTSLNISALIFSSTSPHSPSSTAAENQTRNGNSIRKTIAKWLRLQRPNNSNKSSDVKKQNHGRSRYKLTGMGIKPNLYTYPSTIKSMLMLWHTKLIY